MKKIKPIAILFSFVFTFSLTPVLGQLGTISGVVTDADGKDVVLDSSDQGLPNDVLNKLGDLGPSAGNPVHPGVPERRGRVRIEDLEGCAQRGIA